MDMLEVVGGPIKFPVRAKTCTTLGGGFKKANFGSSTPRKPTSPRKPTTPRKPATPSRKTNHEDMRIAALERELRQVKAQLAEQTPEPIIKSLVDTVIPLAASHDQLLENLEAQYLREREREAPPLPPTMKCMIPSVSRFSRTLDVEKPAGAGAFCTENVANVGTPRVMIDSFLLTTIEDIFLEVETKARLKGDIPSGKAPVCSMVDQLELSLGASLYDTVRTCPQNGNVTLQNVIQDIRAHPEPFIDWSVLHQYLTSGYAPTRESTTSRSKLESTKVKAKPESVKVKSEPETAQPRSGKRVAPGRISPKRTNKTASSGSTGDRSKTGSPVSERDRFKTGSPVSERDRFKTASPGAKGDCFKTATSPVRDRSKTVTSPVRDRSKTVTSPVSDRSKTATSPVRDRSKTATSPVSDRSKTATRSRGFTDCMQKAPICPDSRMRTPFVEKRLHAIRDALKDEFKNLENAYRQLVRIYPSGKISADEWVDFLEIFPRMKSFLDDTTAVRVFNSFDPDFTGFVPLDQILGVDKAEIVTDIQPKTIEDTFGQPSLSPSDQKHPKSDVERVNFTEWVHEAPIEMKVEKPVESKHWQLLKSVFTKLDQSSSGVNVVAFAREARTKMPEWLSAVIYWKEGANLEGPGAVPTTLGQSLDFLEEGGGDVSWAEARRVMESAPKKRKPKIDEFMKLNANEKPFEANKWMTSELKVDGRILNRIYDVFSYCQLRNRTKVRKDEFMNQIRIKPQLVQDFHKQHIADTTATWSEILPDIACSKDVILWSDVLEIIKYRNANPRTVTPPFCVDRTNLDKSVAINNGMLVKQAVHDPTPIQDSQSGDRSEPQDRLLKQYFAGDSPMRITRMLDGDMQLASKPKQETRLVTKEEIPAHEMPAHEVVEKEVPTKEVEKEVTTHEVALGGDPIDLAWEKLQHEFVWNQIQQERMRKEDTPPAPLVIAPVITTIGNDLDDVLQASPAPPPDLGDILPEHRFLREEPRAYDPFSYQKPRSTSPTLGWAHFAPSTGAGRPPRPPELERKRMAAEAIEKRPQPELERMRMDAERIETRPSQCEWERQRMDAERIETRPSQCEWERQRMAAEAIETNVIHIDGREPARFQNVREPARPQNVREPERSQSTPARSPVRLGSSLVRIVVDRDFSTCTMREIETMRLQMEALVGCRGVVVKSIRAGSVIVEMQVPEDGIALEGLSRKQVADAFGYDIRSVRVNNKEMPDDVCPVSNDQLSADEYRYRIHVRAGFRPQSASPLRTPSNHVTVPVGFNFLASSNHWAHKSGKRIRERKFDADQEMRDGASQVRPFKATPCPTHVSVPRFSQMLAEDAKRPSQTPSFKARRVPWDVQAPMYEQIVLAKETKRVSDMHQRSKTLLRRSTLPPRLEGLESLGQTWHPRRDVCLRATADEMRADGTRRRSLSPRETKSAKWKPTGSIQEGGALSARSAQETLRPDTRNSTSRTRAQSTKDVPNFAVQHAKFQRSVERAKVEHRSLTKPEPFSFQAPFRQRQPRLVEPTDDPTKDFRWHKKNASKTNARYSRPALDIPLSGPRTTKKTLMAQRAVQNRIQEMRAKEELPPEPSVRSDSEMAHRVKWQVQAGRGGADSIEKKVGDKRDTQADFQRRWRNKLDQIENSVAKRPLLMERQGINSVRERARQNALLRIRGALETHGVPVEGHFDDDEMDVLDAAAVRDR